MAHATNDINSLTRLAGGGVMSAVDASITALVTLITMFFSISWQMTLLAVLPLPFMAFATSRLGRKTHKAFGESQAAFSELNNKVQESVSGIKVTKSFGYQEAELQSFQETNKMTFKKNMHTMKYDSLLILWSYSLLAHPMFDPSCRCLYDSGWSDNGRKFGDLHYLFGHAGLASDGHWLPL